MAYAAHTKSAPLTLVERLREITAQGVASYRSWRDYRTTLNALQALGSRELDDLGISRGDIRAIAFEAAYGRAI